MRIFVQVFSEHRQMFITVISLYIGFLLNLREYLGKCLCDTIDRELDCNC